MMKNLFLILLLCSAVFGEEIKNYNDATEKAATNASRAELKAKLTSETPVQKPIYFKNDNVTSCTSIEQFKCPPLTAQMQANGYSTMIDYINPMNGEVKCSVYDLKKNLDELSDNTLSLEKIYSKTFRKKACVSEYSEANNIPKVSDDNYDKVESVRSILQTRQNELKEQMDKYDSEYKTSGGKTYLDLADWLDALSTIDNEKINIKQTLQQWEIATTQKFTIEPNQLLLSKFDTNIESIIKMYNQDITTAELDYEIKNRIRQEDKNKIVANSNYVMYLDFFLSSNESVNEALHMIMAMFIGWNVIIGWLFNSATKKMAKQDSQQDHINKLVFGIGSFIMLFGGTIQSYKIVDDSGNTVKDLTFKTTRIQSLVRGIYAQANDLSDAIAKDAISAYLHGLDATSGVATVDAYNSYASERNRLKKERKIIIEANKQCLATYDFARIKSALTVFRQKNLSLNKGGGSVPDNTGVQGNINSVTNDLFGSTVFNKDISELDFNPFPKSEREIFAAMTNEKGELTANPYALIKDGGFVVNSYYDSTNKTTTPKANNFYMSMSGCNNVRNKMISGLNRINDIDKKMADIADEDKHATTLERLKIVHDLMWKNYADLGYISVAFLPATALLIDKQGVLGDGKKREQNIQDATNGGGESYAQKIATALPMFALFGGGNIADSIYAFGSAAMNVSINTVKSFIPLPDFILKRFTGDGKVHTDSKSALGTMLSLVTANTLLNNMLNATLFIVLISVAIVQFILLALNKLFTFFATMFLVIFTFSDNAQQQLATALGKIIATAFKSVLLVISITLAIYAMSLVDSLEAILVNGFFANMGTLQDMSKEATSWDFSNNFSSLFNYINLYVSLPLVKYSYYGVGHLGLMIVKIYLVINIITKYPGYFYDLIGAKVNDVGEDIINSVQGANEQQNLKGI